MGRRHHHSAHAELRELEENERRIEETRNALEILEAKREGLIQKARQLGAPWNQVAARIGWSRQRVHATFAGRIR